MLTSKQRAQLRGLASTADTIVQVGKGGISENVIEQVTSALRARELVKGRVLDVAVDLRPDSKTFGKHVAVEISEDDHRQFYIPKGFAHGFSVLSDEVIFQYKCDDFYCPEAEGAIAWDDPDLAIDWKVPEDKIILSEKDKRHPRLRDCRPEDFL